MIKQYLQYWHTLGNSHYPEHNVVFVQVTSCLLMSLLTNSSVFIYTEVKYNECTETQAK